MALIIRILKEMGINRKKFEIYKFMKRNSEVKISKKGREGNRKEEIHAWTEEKRYKSIKKENINPEKSYVKICSRER